MVLFAGADLTAEVLNAEVDPDWVAFTPTWTASGTAPALGNGKLSGSYHRIGTKVAVRFFLLAGTTTTFGTGNYNFALPFTAATIPDAGGGETWVGGAYGNNAGVSVHSGVALIASAASVVTVVNTGTAALYGQTVPFTWGNADRLTVSITYECVP